MLRARLNQALAAAMKAKQPRRVSTIRLTLAAIKDRDIAARTAGRGDGEGVSDDDILAILQKMVKQRQESIGHYEEAGRVELAQQEQEEIDVINEFLPQQLSGEEMQAAVREVLAETGARSIKDMGPTMAVLKERYAGRMNFAEAAAVLKKQLAG
ncbi:MAG TPA: GatB/YqeY domain-containing protein [Alphaproteobacteria bacterium]|nr:GatB/YqeY domain-containing protein [Alphaproteobacteria bacterium]